MHATIQWYIVGFIHESHTHILFLTNGNLKWMNESPKGRRITCTVPLLTLMTSVRIVIAATATARSGSVSSSFLNRLITVIIMKRFLGELQQTKFHTPLRYIEGGGRSEGLPHDMLGSSWSKSSTLRFSARFKGEKITWERVKFSSDLCSKGKKYRMDPINFNNKDCAPPPKPLQVEKELGFKN